MTHEATTHGHRPCMTSNIKSTSPRRRANSRMACPVVTALVLLATVAAASTASVAGVQQDSAAGRQAFLDLHNKARADVGVAPLVWDDTVASYAQSYAAARQGDCELVHSNGPYGENIFWGSAGASWTASDAVGSWISEKQYYNCSGNSCASGMVCSHYTQVVWARTTKLGCATVTCNSQNPGTFIVCEYDPPGNGPGLVPYAGCWQFVNGSAQNLPQDFLDLQNVARIGVGIGMLTWDSTVAAYAQSYAEKRMRDCKKIYSHGPYGENIFQGARGISWTASDALFAWLAEKQYYNCTSNTCQDGQTCADYTQVIWANSTRVGCASVDCDDSVGGGTFMTCNYEPPGNKPGERPYIGCAQAGSTPPPVPGNGTSPSTGSGNNSPKRKDKNPSILTIVIPVVTVGLILAISICIWRRSRIKRKLSSGTILTDLDDIEDIKSLLLDPAVIRTATENFAEVNKLGEGGFGQVYKGLMPDGQEIAVKRLAGGSKQGLRELRNELLLVARLQHRNLVKLIGACLYGRDKLLVYEYIPNKSLDTFIYDAQKREGLVWDIRYKIICGIGRGLVYLHDESRLKVIHRDLKPSNILLEMDMNPKISDFGLASVFEGDHSKHITRRVAGTYGYMAPEYAVLGHVSAKSDVFSYGVIILEILTGRRNNVSSSETMMSQHLLSYVWDNWTRGTVAGIVDPLLHYNCDENVVLKCIHIGLLCVQENPTDRPSMSNVILLLVGRSTTLPSPSRPAFLFRLDDVNNSQHEEGNDLVRNSDKSNSSLNKVTITELAPR